MFDSFTTNPFSNFIYEYTYTVIIVCRKSSVTALLKHQRKCYEQILKSCKLKFNLGKRICIFFVLSVVQQMFQDQG